MTQIAVFLTLSGDEATFLDSVIKKLSTLTKLPPFSAHATIYFGTVTDLPLIAEHWQASFKEFGAVTLLTEPLKAGETYWRSVFIPLTENPALIDICSQLAALIPDAKSYKLYPHMSVCYGVWPREFSEKLQTLVPALPPRVVCDTVQLIALHNEAAGWENPENWNIVRSTTLKK